MNQSTSKQVRVLAIALSARGFGYSVIEDQNMLESGSKGVKGNKNLNSVSKVEKLMNLFRPSVLVLQDVNAKGCHRAQRIKALNQQVIELEKKRKCKITLLSGKRLRTALLGDVKGTKYEMAEMLAQKLSVELAGKLPPKRQQWGSEDGRMDMFDAVGLAVVFRMRKGQ
jgi:hypothetical protein